MCVWLEHRGCCQKGFLLTGYPFPRPLAGGSMFLCMSVGSAAWGLLQCPVGHTCEAIWKPREYTITLLLKSQGSWTACLLLSIFQKPCILVCCIMSRVFSYKGEDQGRMGYCTRIPHCSIFVLYLNRINTSFFIFDFYFYEAF